MEEYTYIDFDGVILDTLPRMLERKYYLGYTNHQDESEYYRFFEKTNNDKEVWNYIIKGAKPINDSINIIRKLESLKKKLAILTRIYSKAEQKVKLEIKDIYKISSPFIFVPPELQKHEVVIPNGQRLIDDSRGNVLGWNENGGKGILFCKDIDSNTKDKVKSLSFLLKK